MYAYLEQMTKHKAIDTHRRRAAKKRGNGAAAGRVDLDDVADRESSFADDFALEEEIHLTSAKLTRTERKICMYRVDKYSWTEIGELLGISASAAQKQYERALKRVLRERQSG